MHLPHVAGDEGLFVGVEVRVDGTAGGAGRFQGSRVEDAGEYLFDFLHPPDQLLPGRRFVPAPGRADDDSAGMVAELGEVDAGLHPDGFAAVRGGHDLGGDGLAAQLPPGEPLAVLLDDLGGAGHRPAFGSLEQAAHDSRSQLRSSDRVVSRPSPERHSPATPGGCAFSSSYFVRRMFMGSFQPLMRGHFNPS